MSEIDWKRVNERLRCPICGDKASIEAESDGTSGSHYHRFPITRAMAVELSRPTEEEAAKARAHAIEILREHGIKGVEGQIRRLAEAANRKDTTPTDSQESSPCD